MNNCAKMITYSFKIIGEKTWEKYWQKVQKKFDDFDPSSK